MRSLGTLFAAVLLLSAGGFRLHAQGGELRQLGAEVQNIERMLAGNIQAAERHGLLVRLAGLRQLSGDFSGAAANWLEAAAVNPADDFALVSGAYALAAIGEWERATLTIRPFLASAKGGPQAVRARYLDATIRAWTASDISALTALAADPEAVHIRPAVYYTLWWTEARDPATFTGNGERWRTRLLSEFPASPEARIASTDSGGSGASIEAMHGPMWLLLPGLPAGTPLGVPEDSTLAGLVAGRPEAGASTAPPTHGQQTGLFRNEGNAKAHAETLTKSGFAAVILRRQSDGSDFWAVVVPTHNPTATAGELRAAGHDSFTVRLGN